jgi:hypothetical protein
MDRAIELLLTKTREAVRWEDEEKATYDLGSLRRDFNRHLYGAAAEGGLAGGERMGYLGDQEKWYGPEEKEPRTMLWDIRKGQTVVPGVQPFEAEDETEARAIALASLGFRITAHRCTVENCACRARETVTRKDERKRT